MTDRGRERNQNEDALLADDALGLYVVSDGMGGHAAGDVASREAVAAVARHVHEHRELLARIREGQVSDTLLTSLAASAVAEASRAVYGKSLDDPALTGMGCTLTVLIVGRARAAMAHVGDSRLYLYRNHRVRQLSADHSLAQELVRLGVINAVEADFVPEGHSLTRAVGLRASVSIDELLIHTRPSDTFLLCSDGLWDYLASEQALDEFLAESDVAVSARSLVAYANRAGGHDNITALVVRIDEDAHAVEAVSCSPHECSSISNTLKIVHGAGDTSGSHNLPS